MNKQKKTKLMAALSLLLTCAPCNFANAMEKENNNESTTEINEEILNNNDYYNDIDDTTKTKNITKKLAIELVNDEDEDENNTHKIKFKTKIKNNYQMEDSLKYEEEKNNESLPNNKIVSEHESLQIPTEKNTEKNIGDEFWPHQMVSNNMKWKRTQQKLLLGIGIPVGGAALGIVGYGVYKGIKKMKKDGKPQPTKNVENKGKKLVSPNVKSN